MGQAELLQCMIDLRKSGDHSYHTSGDLYLIIRAQGIEADTRRICDDLTRLWNFGFIECGGMPKHREGTAYRNRLFRARL